MRFFTLDNARKGTANYSIHWKICFLFRIIVFSATPLMLQKWSCNFHSDCQNTLWTLLNCFLRSVRLDNARKNSPKSLFRWKSCLFYQKILFSTTYVLKKWCYSIHSSCQTTFWTFINRLLRFVTIDHRRKSKANFFSSLKRLPFFKKIKFPSTS